MAVPGFKVGFGAAAELQALCLGKSPGPEACPYDCPCRRLSQFLSRQCIFPLPFAYPGSEAIVGAGLCHISRPVLLQVPHGASQPR